MNPAVIAAIGSLISGIASMASAAKKNPVAPTTGAQPLQQPTITSGGFTTGATAPPAIGQASGSVPAPPTPSRFQLEQKSVTAGLQPPTTDSSGGGKTGPLPAGAVGPPKTGPGWEQVGPPAPTSPAPAPGGAQKNMPVKSESGLPPSTGSTLGDILGYLGQGAAAAGAARSAMSRGRGAAPGGMGSASLGRVQPSSPGFVAPRRTPVNLGELLQLLGARRA